MELNAISLKKLAGCDERLHMLAVEAAKDAPIEFIITSGYRSVEEQQKLFAKGRTEPGNKVTNCDGVKNKSMHNYYPSKAFDFAAFIDDKISWDEHFYLNLGNHFKHVAERMNMKITWGGDFKSFKDLPHIQLL